MPESRIEVSPHGTALAPRGGDYRRVRLVFSKLLIAEMSRGWEGRGISLQLSVRCRVQSPASATTGEQRLPHGSDWSSIRGAGRKPAGARVRRAATGSRSLRVGRQTRVNTHRQTPRPTRTQGPAPKRG